LVQHQVATQIKQVNSKHDGGEDPVQLIIIINNNTNHNFSQFIICRQIFRRMHEKFIGVFITLSVELKRLRKGYTARFMALFYQLNLRPYINKKT
jgi:hypothetical protein